MAPSDVVISATERVVLSFERLPDFAATAPELARHGRFLTCDFSIEVGAVPLSVRIVEGRIRSVDRGPFLLKPHTFTISAEPEAWVRFLEPLPAPGYHDLFALTKNGHARVSGDLVPFMGNLQYVKDVLALPRRLAQTGTNA